MRYVDMCPSRRTPYDDDYPCAVCGQHEAHCLCHECPVCGEFGCPQCYEASGCGQALSEVQLASRERVSSEQEEEAKRADEWARQEIEDARLAEEYWAEQERDLSRQGR